MLYLFYIFTYFLTVCRFFNKEIDRIGEDIYFLNLFCIIKQLTINLFIITPITFYFINYQEENTLFIPIEIILNHYVDDYVHFFLHIYLHKKQIHRKRHSKCLLSFTTFYAHWLDFFLLNLFSPLIGLIIMKAHIYSYYIYMILDCYISIIRNMGIGNHYRTYHWYYEDCNYGKDLIIDKIYKKDFPRESQENFFP